MHIADLTENIPKRFEVGWLHPDEPFRQGAAPAGFVARLKEFSNRARFCSEAFNWGAYGGYHTCEFCQQAHATGSLGVLFEGKLYHAPTMIIHYVEHHQYVPPDEFIEAVMSGPLPGTPEFAATAALFQR